MERTSRRSFQRQPCAHCGAATHRSTPHHRNLYLTLTPFPSLIKILCLPCPRWYLLPRGKVLVLSSQSLCSLVAAYILLSTFDNDYDNLFIYFRAVVSPAKALVPAIRPLLNAALQSILLTVSRVFPHAEMGLKRKREQGAVLLYLVILALLLHACYVHHRNSFKKSKTERNNKKMRHTKSFFHFL